MNTSRARLRQHFKQQRLAVAPAARSAAITAITHHLSTYFAQRARPDESFMVGAFMATAEEVDLGAWLTSHLDQGGRAALPRIRRDGIMNFHAYTASMSLTLNRYGIAEPAASCTIVEATELDVVLVPLVAFDRTGTRLGMGGGYYDRYLTGLRADARTLGIAFACQESAQALPREPWDVPLHAVVTENGMLELP